MTVVTIVLPTKNEEATIGNIIDQVKGYGQEILVIDGHSTDRTRPRRRTERGRGPRPPVCRGQSAALGENKAEKSQHKGLGKLLLGKAEEIAKKAGCSKIRIISGVGVRL